MRPAVLVFALCTVACALAHAAILRSVVRSRSARIDAAVPRPRLLVEIVWALVPVLALAFLLTATWDRIREHAPTKPTVTMKIAQ